MKKIWMLAILGYVFFFGALMIEPFESNPFKAWAGRIQQYHMMIIGQEQAAGGCDDCSGGLMFAWHMENVDVTLGTPCGCSDGDTTATLSGDASISSAQKSDGTYSVLTTDANDWYEFDITSYDIASDAAGTITVDIYVVTWAADSRIVMVSGDESNKMLIGLAGTDEITAYWKGNNVAVQATTSGANLAINTWYSVTAKWQQTGDPNLYIEANSVSASSNTDLTDPTVEWNKVYVGTSSSAAGSIYIDNLKIYNSYL